MKNYFYLLSLLAGLAVAIQTGVNSQLRQDTNSPVLTALISFVTGTIALTLLYFLFFKKAPIFPAGFEFTWWKFTGGLLGVVYVTIIVIAAPKIGAANALGFIVAGQFIAATIIDHFGLLGMPVNPISVPRILGIVVLICGVYLIQRK